MSQGNLKVLFEDNQILVVVKPYGLLSQSDITEEPDILTELKKYLKKKHSKPGNVFLGLVHRLDKNVGGVMVFAKNSKSAARLSKQIHAHKFKKLYIAVVHGRLENKTATLKHYLLKSAELKRSVAYSKEVPDSKYAELNYNVLDSNNEKSLVSIELKTGRPHQIRVQLSTIGHPIIGDKLYIEGVRDSSSAIALWAYSLSFFHPVTQEFLTFKDLPPKNYPWSDFFLENL